MASEKNHEKSVEVAPLTFTAERAEFQPAQNNSGLTDRIWAACEALLKEGETSGRIDVTGKISENSLRGVLHRLKVKYGLQTGLEHTKTGDGKPDKVYLKFGTPMTDKGSRVAAEVFLRKVKESLSGK